MICKRCLEPVNIGKPFVNVAGIGIFHKDCIKPEEERRLEERIDDVRRWAIEVGIIRIDVDHVSEHADA